MGEVINSYKFLQAKPDDKRPHLEGKSLDGIMIRNETGWCHLQLSGSG
jgi:hypothetical protein